MKKNYNSILRSKSLIVFSFLICTVHFVFSQNSIDINLEVEKNSLNTQLLKKIKTIIPIDTNFEKKFKDISDVDLLIYEVEDINKKIERLSSSDEINNLASKIDGILLDLNQPVEKVNYVSNIRNKLQEKLGRAKSRLNQLQIKGNPSLFLNINPENILNSLAKQGVSNMSKLTKNLVKTKYIQASNFYDTKNYTKAIEKIEEIEQLTGNEPMIESLRLKVNCLIKSGDYKKASQELYKLQGLNITNDILNEVAINSSIIEKKLEEEKIRIETEDRLKKIESNDNIAWDRAKTLNSIDAYKDYISIKEHTIYIDQAKNEIDKLLWNNATKSKIKVDFEKYIEVGISEGNKSLAEKYLKYWDEETLDLRGALEYVEQLTTISYYINLKELDISKNKIEKLPKNIGDLSNLKKLNISNNEIKKLPKEIENLKNLEVLNISYNKIELLNPNIKFLEKLNSFDASNNPLKELTKVISELNDLEFLNLSNTSILRLPDTFGFLKGLKRLNLNRTLLSSIPDSFVKLEKLEVLKLENTPLETLPNNFDSLINLRNIFLDKESAKKLKPFLKLLKKNNNNFEIVKT